MYECKILFTDGGSLNCYLTNNQISKFLDIWGDKKHYKEQVIGIDHQSHDIDTRYIFRVLSSNGTPFGKLS
jgi:hypothetical protein